MKLTDNLLDFIFSLIYAGKNLENYKEYRDLVKIVDKNYLQQIANYQTFLQQNQKVIEFFVTEEYNLLSYVVIRNDLRDFDSLMDCLNQLKKEEFFQLIAKDLLENKETFSTEALLPIPLEEKNKWKLVELFHNYEKSKANLLEALTKSWEQYLKAVEHLTEQFQTKIDQEKRRLQKKSDALYLTVYQDYISKEDYQTATDNYLFLISFQTVLFIKHEQNFHLGLGIFAHDYLEFIQAVHSYDSESRERFLKILADPTRYGILKLIQEGVSTNKIIANKFKISPAAVSYQLKHLSDNQVILLDAQSKKYHLNKKILKQVLRAIEKDLYLDEETS